MSQAGVLSIQTGGGGTVETLTGNSGGPVGPTGFNIDVLGNNTSGINIVGDPGTSTLTVVGIQATTTQRGTVTLATATQTGLLVDSIDVVTPAALGPILTTPYVVAPGGAYTTIQAAVNAAHTAGGGIVIVRPGTYTENLTLYDAVHIMGLDFSDAGGGVIIIGQHTPPATGGFVFNNVALQSATNIFNSAVAGSAHLVVANAAVTVTNGYTFNLPNWTGKLESFDVNAAIGTNDGYVNNTAGAVVVVFESSVGSGTLNPMIVSGVTIGSAADMYCPMQFITGSNAEFDAGYFAGPVTFSNNSTGVITTSHIVTGSLVAITMSSSGAWTIATTVIDSSHSPAIAGAGAGSLQLSDVTFLNNALIANTLTLGTSGGWYPPGNPGSAGFLLTSNGPGVVPTFQAASGSTFIETLTGNSGGAISPTAGNINTLGTGSLTVVGSGSTLTAQLTGLTNHNVLVGAGSATITKVAPSATSGVPFISQGSAADPTFGTAVVAGGGTGNTTFTAFAPVCAGTTATGPFQSAATGFATSGFVLTSNGSSALPSFQAVSASGAVETINGDTGSCTPSAGTVTIKAGVSTQNCGSSVEFVNSASTSTLNVTDATSNTILGSGAGLASFSGSRNTCLGVSSFSSVTNASDNTGIGTGALENLTTGQSNTALGRAAGQGVVAGINTVSIGYAAGNGSDGSYNVSIGYGAGTTLTTTDSNNILILNGGVSGDNNTIRIGTQGTGAGQQSKCFIAGIEGVSVSNLNYVTINTSTGQLGSVAGATFTWSDTSGSFSAVAENGYFITAASTPTLPASPSEGDTIAFVVDNASTCTITGNTGQKIRLGAALSAAAGTCANNARGDTIELVYRSTGTTWFATSSVGTWTIT